MGLIGTVRTYTSESDAKKILYVGGFRFPHGTASAQRAIENARLIADCGYSVALMGKQDVADENAQYRDDIAGFPFFNIEKLNQNKSFRSYITHIDSIRYVIEGPPACSKLYAIAAYNYPSLAFRRLNRC